MDLNRKIKQLSLIMTVGSITCVMAVSSFAQGGNLGSADKGEGVVKKQISQLGSQFEKMTGKELIGLAWDASSKGDTDRLNKVVDQCLFLSGEEAVKIQISSTAFPERGTEGKNEALNNVGTCLFIQAEFLMNHGKTPEAVAAFQNIIKHYSWSMAWDPRGWYWSISEKSQASIDVIEGNVIEEVEVFKVNRTKPILHTKGTEKIVDYTKYGEFLNLDGENYHYRIKDLEGLKKAVGEGIYPNISGISKNPGYRKAKKEGRFKDVDPWDFVNTDDLEMSYYMWFRAKEPWGIRLFYIGMAFEKADMYYQAIKAYHALIIHYPKTVGWTYWQTPWYPGQAAIAKIHHIIRMHPELNLEEKFMKIQVKNGYDNQTDNDVILTHPGKIVQKGFLQRGIESFISKKTSLGKPVKKVGKGTVRLVQYGNGHWQLLVKNKPYVIKGITYAPTKIGQTPDKGTLKNWMEEDSNQNGVIDGPYESWVDKNRNNTQDDDEPIVGDFQLMKDMGVNTIRFYHVPDTPNKKVLRKMFKKYGIRVILGDFVGKYTLGSGATWMEGTDYENPEHQQNMFESVKKMVLEHKDEPYILMWLLGNENNYGVACNADKKPEAYFQFIDEVAQWIKSVDKNHPVAVSNGDTLYLDKFAQHSPNIDIFAANVYRGDYGFGSYWEQILDATGKPAFITEYGCPSYARHLTLEEAEDAQAEYHRGNWMDIEENLAGHSKGVGNAIGGVTFEWMDEWWKNYEPFRHDKTSDAIGPFPGGYYFEEWFGLVSQGNGKHSPFMRQLRKSYFVYKDMWNKN